MQPQTETKTMDPTVTTKHKILKDLLESGLFVEEGALVLLYSPNASGAHNTPIGQAVDLSSFKDIIVSKDSYEKVIGFLCF